nr:PEP-CTERM sorting domain-containing protein [Geobacter hydrogenophilus]
MLLAGGTVHGEVILDNSPSRIGATIFGGYGSFSNFLSLQSFADNINFVSGATITGMDIYSVPYKGTIGQQVTVRLWADNGGEPGILLDTINTTISIIDNDGATSGNNRKHADITPLLLTADTTYWIGMTGNPSEIEQTILNNVDDNKMTVFNDGSWYILGRDMAFRLEGDINPSTVPEPSSFILLGAGLAGVGLLTRRMRQ